jgi:hypothetical protein
LSALKQYEVVAAFEARLAAALAVVALSMIW